MTVEEVIQVLSCDYTNLADENYKLIEDIMATGRHYISQFLELNENVERVLLPQYVAVKLLERKGYLELAEKHWERFRVDLSALMKIAPEQSTSRIVVDSRERMLKDDMLSRW
ncbi:MAG: hypothetical protein QXQ53_07735 [Candidatus Methanosuratincola sp.]